MRKAAFALCADHNAYVGYTSGRLWNGWSTPYFTIKEALRLQYNISNSFTDTPMLYDATKDEFYIKYDGYDEPYIWKGEDIQTVDGIKHLYGIGAYSHMWDEIDDAIKRSLAEQICEFLTEYDIDLYEDHYECGDDFLEDILDSLADIDTFAKAYTIMNNDNLGSDEIYTQIRKALEL